MAVMNGFRMMTRYRQPHVHDAQIKLMKKLGGGRALSVFLIRSVVILCSAETMRFLYS
jgi:hypothetical protein